MGIGINGKKAEINQDRIDGIIDKLTEGDFEKQKWLLGEPIVNYSQSIVDDTIKTNAEFHHKLGLVPQVTRTVVGNCCDWCREKAGTYNYPLKDETIYQRHRYCRCIVEYDPKNGRRQNVHTKSWMDISEKKYRIINARTLDIKSLNTRDDRIQYLKMRDTLGKDNMPDTLDKFQDMKYNNSDKYERLLDKAFIQDKFNKGIWKDKINIEKQKRHIKSTAKKGKSYFYDDVDLEKLYDVNKMTGKFRRKNGTNEHNYELIDLPKNIDIGIDIYSGNSINGFTIHYSKTGSHLIPTYSKREE